MGVRTRAMSGALLLALGCGPGLPTSVDPNYGAGALPALKSRITLTDMQEGDVVTLHWASQGCYHDNARDLRLERSATGDFHVTGQVWSRFLPGKTAGVTGTLRLADIVALDWRLDRYRRVGGPGYCTTRTQVRLSWLRDDRTVGRESFDDSSCPGFDDGAERGAVAFDHLLRTAWDSLYRKS